ncbi:AAA family ATPase [Burkholderia sp. BCC1985]|uniref:AAA family ATPase n=1 Tax=Burkholderia sp. BCC1985 TaxID=2817442 RepID=UPI002AB04995|nr:AAA family ATPase [Burkholderia sp. BCC1985]
MVIYRWRYYGCCFEGVVNQIIRPIGEYDRLLGTKYLDHIWRGATVIDLANLLYRIAKRHRTGLIVIDELQNALRAVERSDPLFDFFVGLTNGGGIPIIVIGTPKSERLFRKTLRSARRISSHGVIQWNGMRDAAAARAGFIW